MKYVYFFIALALLSSCNSNSKKSESEESVISSDSLNDKEAEYLKTRDTYIEQFKRFEKSPYSDSLSKVHSEALLDLEIRLQEILKDARYTGHGKINLETLIPSMGFGMMDGLWFEKDSLRMFYTSKNLFLNYFNVNMNNLTNDDLAVIFQSAFFDNAGVFNFAHTRINENAIGAVALVTQMTSPFPPYTMFAIVSKGDFIYLIERQFKKPIVELPKCKSISDSIIAEAEKQGDRYRASNLQDTAALNKRHRLDELAFTKHCECYQKQLATDPQFEAIKKQLENMVKYLEQ